MNYNEDETKYKDLIDQLKNLKEVQAPGNFHSDLMRRINSETDAAPKLFGRYSFKYSRLIPAAGAIAAVIIIIFLFNFGQSEAGNPLLTDPQVRKDIVTAGNLSGLIENESAPKVKNNDSNNSYSSRKKLETSKGNKSRTNQPEKKQPKSSGTSRNQSAILISFPGDKYIHKNGLNFRQINLLPKERIQVKKLKEQMEQLFHQDSHLSGK